MANMENSKLNELEIRLNEEMEKGLLNEFEEDDEVQHEDD